MSADNKAAAGSGSPKAGEEKIVAKMVAGLSDAEKKEFSVWCSPYQPDGTEFGVRGVVRASGGGTKFVDKEELAKQNGVVADVIKAVGGNIMSGISVINVSLPVRIFESRSYLERITDVWCYAPIFLRRAALTKDPVERMKWVITFLVSGLHRGVKQLKPFNPILGETLQCEYRDGTRLYLEQLAHHPPVTAFEVIGPNNLFYYHGHHEFTASFRPAGITGGQKGENIVEFQDGTRITFPAPMIFMTGLLGLYGDRCFQWIDFKGQPLNFVDAKNNLKCDLKFNPDQISGLSSLVYTQKTPSDRVRGFITHNTPPKDPKHPVHLSEVDGSWLDDIKFDGVPYWTHGQLQPFFPAEMEGAAAEGKVAGPSAAAAAAPTAAAPAAGAAAANGNSNGHGAVTATPAAAVSLAAKHAEDNLPHAPSCTDVVLPSDSRFRADLIALKKALANGSPKPEMDAAQRLKETLEVAQRKDRKLRKDLAKIKDKTKAKH